MWWGLLVEMVGWGWGCSAAPLGYSLESYVGFCRGVDSSKVYVHSVMAVQEEHSELVPRVGAQGVPDSVNVPSGLGHLLALDIDESGVDPVLYERSEAC